MQNSVPSQSSSALPSAGRREDERSETERSPVDGKAGAEAGTVVHPYPQWWPKRNAGGSRPSTSNRS